MLDAKEFRSRTNKIKNSFLEQPELLDSWLKDKLVHFVRSELNGQTIEFHMDVLTEKFWEFDVFKEELERRGFKVWKNRGRRTFSISINEGEEMSLDDCSGKFQKIRNFVKKFLPVSI